MDENARNYPTRMHEILGVEPYERFTLNGVAGDREYVLDEYGVMGCLNPAGSRLIWYAGAENAASAINNGIVIVKPTEATHQGTNEHLIHLRRLRSQQKQFAMGKRTHWLDRLGDSDKAVLALDAAIEALEVEG